MENCRAAYGCRVLGRYAPKLSSRRRSCPTRHNQRYARADVGTVGDHLVLWGGLLEAVTAVIVARRSPTWPLNFFASGAMNTSRRNPWGMLNRRTPLRPENCSAQRCPF